MNRDLPSPSALPPLTVVGAGKLGGAVAEAWKRHGGTVAAFVHKSQDWEPSGLVFEATAPEAAFEHVLKCLEAGVPVVTGTTGWLDRLGELESRSTPWRSSVFWSTNFSPGVHALNLIAGHAAKIMSQLEGYTAHIREVHHVHKKDAPSGTALTLKQCAQLGGWPHPLDIESAREGDVVGLHALAWDSAHDSVVLQHEAKSRLGFAEGAVWALQWTWERQRRAEFGLYTMTDLFQK
jgi:4-hydroxy-tetrahydrodipicolinate reductase